MNTDSFIDSQRRPIARQGKPEIIRSDNGKNFTSGEKEIREEILQWNQRTFTNFLSSEMDIQSSNVISHGRGMGTSNKVSQKDNRCLMEE